MKRRLLRLRNQKVRAQPRLERLARKYGEPSIYWRLALRLYEQFKEAVHDTSSQFGERDRILAEKTKSFIPAKIFEEAKLRPKAREVIIMNARRWALCPLSSAHSVQKPEVWDHSTTNSTMIVRPLNPPTLFCKKCGWNHEGVLTKSLEHYTSFELKIARAMKFD